MISSFSDVILFSLLLLLIITSVIVIYIVISVLGLFPVAYTVNIELSFFTYKVLIPLLINWLNTISSG